MGITTAKCCVQELVGTKNHESFTISKPPKTKSHVHVHKYTDTDEFISSYGSHFSGTVTTGTAQHTHSRNRSSSSENTQTSTSDETESSSTEHTYSNSDTTSSTCSHCSTPSATYSEQSSISVHSMIVHSVTHSSSIECTPMPATPNVRAFKFDEADELNINPLKCNVNNCKAVKRIIKALEWHSPTVYDDNHEHLLIQKIFDNEYNNQYMDDYQHLLNDHLFEVDIIRNEINKQIEPCDIKKCAAYLRYAELCSKDLSQCDGTRFCLEFMDLIHCYIIHSKHNK